MKTVTILLDTIEKVRKFVNQISQYEGDFDIISDRYIIDAKSIMGIFSLDLSKPLKLSIHAEASVDKVLEDFKEFIV
ncbi:MAG: HPr family phosphocarrier protein [Defluviitaleaceae bacterium]|nr:HPr family phosphocarrier protein [Defluviitaleaceae bacterium]